MSTKKFYKTTLLLGSTYAIIAVLNLVKQKIIAHYTGLHGMGILGLVNPYSYLLYAFGSLSVFAGVTKYISEYKLKENQNALSTLWTTAFYTLLFFSLGITLLGLVFAKFFNQFFMGDETLINFFMIVTLSLPFYVLANLYLAAFKGVQSFGRLAATQLIAAILSIFLTFILVIKFQITGMIYSLTLSLIILAMITCLSAMFSKFSFLKSFQFNINRRILRDLMGFSGTVLSTGLLHYGVQFFIRVQIVRMLGMEKNGVIQAALYFSLYFQIIQDAINSYLFPRLSELTDREHMNLDLNTSITLSCLLSIPVIAGLLLFIRPVIYLLLTPDFLGIEKFVVFLFIGDFIRLLFWNLGVILLAQGKLKESFWLSTINAFLYGILIYFFIQYWGATGFAVGYLLTNAIVFLIVLATVTKFSKFRVSWQNGLLLISGLIIIGLCNYIKANNLYLSFIMVLVVILWTVLSLPRKLWDYIKEKLYSFTQ